MQVRDMQEDRGKGENFACVLVGAKADLYKHSMGLLPVDQLEDLA